MKCKFRTLRDWRLSHIAKGTDHLLQRDSANPYIRRLVRLAERYGWNYPFSLASGHASRSIVRPAPIQAGRRSIAACQRQSGIEQDLLATIFGKEPGNE